jgi:hypothetical protein
MVMMPCVDFVVDFVALLLLLLVLCQITLQVEEQLVRALAGPNPMPEAQQAYLERLRKGEARGRENRGKRGRMLPYSGGETRRTDERRQGRGLCD